MTHPVRERKKNRMNIGTRLELLKNDIFRDADDNEIIIPAGTQGVTGCCVECGAEHGEPCAECGGRAYHSDECSIGSAEQLEMDAAYTNSGQGFGTYEDLENAR